MKMASPVVFSHIGKGCDFRYDGAQFRRTATNIAWEIKGGCFIKEWAFMGDEVVDPIIPIPKKKRRK